ncbi:MAG: SH3 domain-containing protein [Chryseobacterium sp.]|nr:MAG: SH3 domain-containing protein [Chryseobacterium sp.]
MQLYSQLTKIKEMKYLLSLMGICLLPICSYAQSVASTKLKEEALGRCSGSAYCSACRNCSRCAHCGSGGTCGVCAPSTASSADYYPSRSISKKKKTKSSNYSNKRTSNLSGVVNSTNVGRDYLEVNAGELSLRKGPGSSYPVVEKLKRKQRLLFISKHDQWTKVKVVSSGNIGYCNKAYIR